MAQVKLKERHARFAAPDRCTENKVENEAKQYSAFVALFFRLPDKILGNSVAGG